MTYTNYMVCFGSNNSSVCLKQTLHTPSRHYGTFVSTQWGNERVFVILKPHIKEIDDCHIMYAVTRNTAGQRQRVYLIHY